MENIQPRSNRTWRGVQLCRSGSFYDYGNLINVLVSLWSGIQMLSNKLKICSTHNVFKWLIGMEDYLCLVLVSE